MPGAAGMREQQHLGAQTHLHAPAHACAAPEHGQCAAHERLPCTRHLHKHSHISEQLNNYVVSANANLI